MQITKDSTLRALRTLYQGFVALAVVAPLLVTVAPVGTPLAVAAASMVAAVALVTKVLNALEAAGIKLPLYPAAQLPTSEAPADPAPAELPEVPTSDAPQADPAP